MANKILTYVDASVLIYAASKPTATTFARRLRALQIFGDPDREFVPSEYLRLEVAPIANYFNKRRESAFYEKFFDNAVQWADSSALITPAYSIACQYGLGALDALHVAAADSFNAEFVSAERPTKPIYRAYSNITSIY
jgi:predicted nucleic acid-binding protein